MKDMWEEWADLWILIKYKFKINSDIIKFDI
jgi:hypothetical protein